jgi:hypothetical protein
MRAESGPFRTALTVNDWLPAAGMDRFGFWIPEVSAKRCDPWSPKIPRLRLTV